MRIATATIYNTGVFNMTNREGDLYKLQNQLSTGRKILSPSDDPVGTARSLVLTQQTEINDQFITNVEYADGTLSLAETNLQQAISLIQDIQQLAVQSGNPVLTSHEKRTVEADIRGKYQQLLGLANTTDAQGQYLFSGFKGDTKPFNEQAYGVIRYDGDEGQRRVQIAASRQIEVSDSGADVFMSIKTGNRTFESSMGLPGLPRTTKIGDGGPIYIDRDPAGGFIPADYRLDYNGTDYTVTRISDGSVSAPISHATMQAGTSVFGMRLIAQGAAPSTPNSFSAINLKLNSNVGTGIVTPGTVYDSVKWNAAVANGSNTQRYKVQFHSVPDPNFPTDVKKNQIRYDIINNDSTSANFNRSMIDGYNYTTDTPANARRDAATGAPNMFPRAYVPGADIELRQLAGEGSPLLAGWDFGAKLAVEGQPADGDSFVIEPSQEKDLFSTIGDFSLSLLNYADSSTGGATFQNTLNTTLQNLDNALSNLLTTQSNIGARLKEMSAVKETNQDLNVQYKGIVSKLNDLDFAAAISDFSLTQTYLDAARKSFSSVQNLSLFQYIS